MPRLIVSPSFVANMDSHLEPFRFVRQELAAFGRMDLVVDVVLACAAQVEDENGTVLFRVEFPLDPDTSRFPLFRKNTI